MYMTKKASKYKGVDVGLEYAILDIQVKQEGMNFI
jgi:hypothetical protein